MIREDDDEPGIGSKHRGDHNTQKDKCGEVLCESIHECNDPEDHDPNIHGRGAPSWKEQYGENGDEDKRSRVKEVAPKEMQGENGGR